LYHFEGAGRQLDPDFYREILVSLVAGQFLQAAGDEGGGLGHVAAVPGDLGTQERQFWPGERRACG
jgi:hypothetical protein